MNALIACYSLLAIERDKSSPVDLKENHSLETLDGVVNVNCKDTAVLVGPSGQKLEIVPESNVMKTRAGEEITFKILLDARDFDLLSLKATFVFSVQ